MTDWWFLYSGILPGCRRWKTGIWIQLSLLHVEISGKSRSGFFFPATQKKGVRGDGGLHISNPVGDKTCQIRCTHCLHVLPHRQISVYELISHNKQIASCLSLVIMCCVLLSTRQSVLNWNSVLLWVDYKATATCSSVSRVKCCYNYRDRAIVWLDRVSCMSSRKVWWNDWDGLVRLKVNVNRFGLVFFYIIILLLVRMFHCRAHSEVYSTICA